MSNPFDQAVSYRTEQNWLRNSCWPARGVIMFRPALEHVDDLMEHSTSSVNHPPKQLDPLLVASIASFGFVFIHPFMDGNGRLSCFCSITPLPIRALGQGVSVAGVDGH